MENLATDLNEALVKTFNMSIFLEQFKRSYFNKPIQPKSLKRIKHIQKQIKAIRTHVKLTNDSNRSKSSNKESTVYNCCRVDRLHSLPKVKRSPFLFNAVSSSNNRLKFSKTGQSTLPRIRNKLSYKKKTPNKDSFLSTEREIDVKDVVKRCVSSFNEAKVSQENRLKRKLDALDN